MQTHDVTCPLCWAAWAHVEIQRAEDVRAIGSIGCTPRDRVVVCHNGHRWRLSQQIASMAGVVVVLVRCSRGHPIPEASSDEKMPCGCPATSQIALAAEGFLVCQNASSGGGPDAAACGLAGNCRFPDCLVQPRKPPLRDEELDEDPLALESLGPMGLPNLTSVRLPS